MFSTHAFGRRTMIAVALLAGSIAASLAPAQVKTPCGETIDRYCKDVVPGSGRIMKCLNDHRDDQSIACKDWVDEQQKNLQDLMAACPEDIARWCRSGPTDKASIYYCLLDNYISLRLDCRSRLGEVRDRLK